MKRLLFIGLVCALGASTALASPTLANNGAALQGVLDGITLLPNPGVSSVNVNTDMLADSAEAAVRSLREPTAPRIRAIVSKIIEARMNDGELDQSSLTLNDIAIIREKYIKLLTGIFHPRISYPQQEEGEGKAQGREGNSKLQAQGERKSRI